MNQERDVRKASKREPRWWFKLVALLLGSLPALALTELFLWRFAPAEFAVRQPFEQHIVGVKPQIIYERNRFGFRSLSMHSERKAENTLRILALGGSTVDQSTQNTEDMWSAILEKLLSQEFADSDRRIEVAAYGEPGAPVMRRLRWAKENIARFEPDLVLTLEGINDLWLLGGPGYTYGGVIEENLFDRRVRQAKKTCVNLSQICARARLAVKELVTRWKLRTGAAIHWQTTQQRYSRSPFVETPARDPDPFQEFSDGLDALLAFLKNSGIDVVVLEQPVLWKLTLSEQERARMWGVNSRQGRVQAGGAWLDREIRRYNARQRELAEKHDAGFVELDGRVPKNLDYFFDDVHYTDRGSRTMATLIFPAVRDRIRERHLRHQPGGRLQISVKNWLVALHQDLSIPVPERIVHPDCTGWSEMEGVLVVQPPLSVRQSLVDVRVHLDESGPGGPLRVGQRPAHRQRLSAGTRSGWPHSPHGTAKPAGSLRQGERGDDLISEARLKSRMASSSIVGTSIELRSPLGSRRASVMASRQSSSPGPQRRRDHRTAQLYPGGRGAMRRPVPVGPGMGRMSAQSRNVGACQ